MEALARESGTDFKPAIARFLDSLIDRSPYTVANYRVHLHRIQELINPVALEDAKVDELIEGLKRYYETRSVGSMIPMVAALKGLLRFVGRGEDLGKIPKFSRRRWLPPEPPTAEQIDTVLEYATLREAAMILMFYSTGARPGEVFGDRLLDHPAVRVEDVDWESGRVRITGKGGYSDYLIFWLRRGQTISTLQMFLRGHPLGPLFPFGYGLAKKLVREAGRRVGVGMNLSLLRHACATSLLRQGVDSAYVNRQLRHVRMDTTMRYLSVTKGDLIALAQKQEWR